MPRERSIPARLPPHGAWPGIMAADLAAAFFDCHDTGELVQCLNDGDVPPPTALRSVGRSREPVWALDARRSTVRQAADCA